MREIIPGPTCANEPPTIKGVPLCAWPRRAGRGKLPRSPTHVPEPLRSNGSAQRWRHTERPESAPSRADGPAWKEARTVHHFVCAYDTDSHQGNFAKHLVASQGPGNSVIHVLIMVEERFRTGRSDVKDEMGQS